MRDNDGNDQDTSETPGIAVFRDAAKLAMERGAEAELKHAIELMKFAQAFNPMITMITLGLAPNFVTAGLVYGDARYVVTCQREGGKLPSERIAELEAELASERAKAALSAPAQCDIPECKGGPECMFDAPVPLRTAEEERADALAWLKREFERLEDLAERERSAGRRDDFQAMARACNVIGNGFEQGAHVGAAERAKAGAK